MAPMISDGMAFLDKAGRVCAADEFFRALLRLPPGDVTQALRQRATEAPVLADLIAGRGPDTVRLPAPDGAPVCDLSRTTGDAGVLLRATPADPALTAHPLEYAMQAVALARLAGSVAHDVKNPLNAMALQLALLGDKISTTSEALAASCVGNLASLKNQIMRVNEVVRRLLDVADPTPSGGFDAGGLLIDAVNLFGHEARRRGVAIACEAAPGAVRASGDPGRAARLLLGLLWRAIASTPEGGKLLARAAAAEREVTLSLEHGRGAPDPALAWMGPVVAGAASSMAGRLEESYHEDTVRVALVLPKERAL
jgi:signal transduction histidine kinase